jgi:hypothetical protein
MADSASFTVTLDQSEMDLRLPSARRAEIINMDTGHGATDSHFVKVCCVFLNTYT